MQFTHIHCSSRFSRSPASLEYAVDQWRKQSSIITLTEVSANARSATISESGWGYYHASPGNGQDECATLWNNSVWVRKYSRVIKLVGRWPTHHGTTLWEVWANTVILQHKTSGHKILFSTIHTPNKTGGAHGFVNIGTKGPERIALYKRMIINWNTHMVALVRSQKPDALVLTADFNLNFRNGWVRNYLTDSFKDLGAAITWKHFTGAGTYGHAVIDGSLYRGLSTSGSVVIPDIHDSTDHTPFKTVYNTYKAARTPITVGGSGSSANDTATGVGTFHGTPWWNFDDYGDPTLYKFEELG